MVCGVLSQCAVVLSAELWCFVVVLCCAAVLYFCVAVVYSGQVLQ